MSITSRLRAAWDCSECRRYRRLAAGFVLLAFLAWLLPLS